MVPQFNEYDFGWLKELVKEKEKECEQIQGMTAEQIQKIDSDSLKACVEKFQKEGGLIKQIKGPVSVRSGYTVQSKPDF